MGSFVFGFLAHQAMAGQQNAIARNYCSTLEKKNISNHNVLCPINMRDPIKYIPKPTNLFVNILHYPITDYLNFRPFNLIVQNVDLVSHPLGHQHLKEQLQLNSGWFSGDK
jgi:hypothetical protein